MTSPHDPYAAQDPLVVDADGTVVKADGTVVPKGTSSEVLEWVGDDREKAKAALDAENSTNKPRKGLVEDLEGLLEK